MTRVDSGRVQALCPPRSVLSPRPHLRYSFPRKHLGVASRLQLVAPIHEHRFDMRLRRSEVQTIREHGCRAVVLGQYRRARLRFDQDDGPSSFHDEIDLRAA